MMYGRDVVKGVNIGTRSSFADIAATILDIFGVNNITDGVSFKKEVLK